MSFTTFNPANQNDNMTMMSFHRSSKAIDRTTAGKSSSYCEWKTGIGATGNPCLLTNATPSAMMVFSVFEKQVFLGQVCSSSYAILVQWCICDFSTSAHGISASAVDIKQTAFYGSFIMFNVYEGHCRHKGRRISTVCRRKCTI